MDRENRVNFIHLILGNGEGGNESLRAQTHVVDPHVVTRKLNHHPLGYPFRGSDAECMRIPHLTLQK